MKKTAFAKPALLPLLFSLLLFSCNNSRTGSATAQPTTTKTASATELQGAWQANTTNAAGEATRAVMVLMDGYMATTFYNPGAKKFGNTYGGEWSTVGNNFTLRTTFSSAGQPKVGEALTKSFTLNGDTLRLQGEQHYWLRLDKGNANALANAWFITGRMQNGEMTRRAVGARKTLKILSDTRFQWVAFNEETSEFSGTGGGTYTTANGKYTENIDFFSRDSSRVGATLTFDYELKDKEWHHRGLSSKGDSIYEIWTPKELVWKQLKRE